MLGGKTAREVAEQRVIQKLGGIERLENKVNPVGGRMDLLRDASLGAVTKDNLINWNSVIGADLALDLGLTSTSARASGGTGLSDMMYGNH